MNTMSLSITGSSNIRNQESRRHMVGLYKRVRRMMEGRLVAFVYRYGAHFGCLIAQRRATENACCGKTERLVRK